MRHSKFLFLAIFFFWGCASKFSSFNERLLEYFNDDKKIDQKEYDDLTALIERTNEKGFEQFKNNKSTDHDKLLAYMLKYFKAKKIPVESSDIWQPVDTKSVNNAFNFNVYLENSASMDGYVKGVTEFETAIYNLLGDIKISGLCDSLNLSYINQSPIAYSKNALSHDIQDFIEKLEPSTFKQRGGDRSISDLKNVLNTVLKSLNQKNVGILISDFVFSPGKNADAQHYLNNQEVGIKIDFANKLAEYDLAVAILQLESNFDGMYYDRNDKPIKINNKRPYYIWVLGSTGQIDMILKKNFLDNIRGGYTNRFVLQSIKGTKEPEYKIMYKPTFGEFESKLLANKIINNASAADNSKNKGFFGFNVAVNFANSLQDENYFLDTGNYVLSNKNYRLEVESLRDKNDPVYSGYTHLLKLQTADLREEILKIDVVGKTPGWVYNYTSTDDSNIATDEGEQEKTFGLKYLVDGVNYAFYPKANHNKINSITITINK